MSSEKIEAETPMAATRPPVKVGLRSSPRSNIGPFCTSWVTRNSTSSAAEPPRLQRTRPAPQPSSPARISPSTSSPSPALKVRKPSQSGRPARGSFDSSTFSSATVIATTQIGRLTQKIQRHDRPLVSTPPRTGPIATATPVVAPKAPNATPRSRPVNALDSSASAVANIAAPPMPWPARAIERKWIVGARPHRNEPTVNSTVPITNTRRRPNRSASDPAVSSSAARLSA